LLKLLAIRLTDNALTHPSTSLYLACVSTLERQHFRNDTKDRSYQLENVAIANALQREAARVTPAFSRFPFPYQHQKQRFDADTLCHAVTLTFDPLTLKVCGTSNVT